jgi:hypothetical protein
MKVRALIDLLLERFGSADWDGCGPAAEADPASV